MLGVFVNVLGILIGGLLGLVLKKGIPERITTPLTFSLALCVFYIGFSGALVGESLIIIIISMMVGTFIGELIDIEGRLERLTARVEKKLSRSAENERSTAQTFLSTGLFYCTGAMAIMGPIQGGLVGNHELLFAKAVIDFLFAIVLASTLGVGVPFSCLIVLVYEGAFALLAQLISPFMTESVINDVSCVGSLMIVALAFNLLKLTKIRIFNTIPAIVFPPILYALYDAVSPLLSRISG